MASTISGGGGGASYHLRRDSEGVYLVTEFRDMKSLQIPYTGNLGLFIYYCVKKMGPFVYFYLKIEAYSYTGEAEKGLFARHIPTMSYVGSSPPPSLSYSKGVLDFDL